jgi:hypothetical protein
MEIQWSLLLIITYKYSIIHCIIVLEIFTQFSISKLVSALWVSFLYASDVKPGMKVAAK